MVLPRRISTRVDLFIGTIFSTFQGELRVETQQVLIRPDAGENEKPRFDIDRGTLCPLRILLCCN